MFTKRPKEKIKEIVDLLDPGSQRNVDKMKNAVRNNKIISDYAKHLPDKKG